MDDRLALHAELCEILGSNNVYFQPPETIKMVYPCIVYSRQNIQTRYADDKPYNINKSYQLTVIDRDPDSRIIDKLLALPMCSHNSHFVVDNLNHDTFTIYY